jgi:hypothetical protein
MTVWLCSIFVSGLAIPSYQHEWICWEFFWIAFTLLRGIALCPKCISRVSTPAVHVAKT